MYPETNTLPKQQPALQGEVVDKELSYLSIGFSALNINHKKGVLKTAQGLLRIQKTHKEMVVDGAYGK